MPPRFLVLLALLVGAAFSAEAQPAAPLPPGQTYAMLIGGIPGEDPYGRWYTDWLSRLQTYLATTAHVSPDHITVLSGKDATMAAITAAFAKLAPIVKPQDQFILFIVGHGETSNDVSTLTLPGPDPTSPEIAKLLDTIPTKNQVILNFSASSGDFLKALSAPGRINITATSPTEIDEPVYAEFFLRGLESKRADAAKKGTITLLDAYNWATTQTALWIVRWVQTSDPKEIDFTTWKASGKETVEIFEKLYSGVPNRKLDPASDRNAEDAVHPLVPPDGQVTGDWPGRRAVDEHALLEDCGEGIGVSAIGDKGLQPILGLKPGDPGYLAGHTVLGQAAPLNP